MSLNKCKSRSYLAVKSRINWWRRTQTHYICDYSSLLKGGNQRFSSFMAHVCMINCFSHCWEPARGVLPVAKVMRLRGPTGKGELGLKGASLNFLKHLPTKPESACLYCIMLFTYASDINRGLSPTTFLWKKLT